LDVEWVGKFVVTGRRRGVRLRGKDSQSEDLEEDYRNVNLPGGREKRLPGRRPGEERGRRGKRVSIKHNGEL